jgi:hypothetical protein
MVAKGGCYFTYYAEEADFLKLKRLQNRVLHGAENLDSCTPVHKLQVVFNFPYVYDHITKLRRTQK